MTRTTIVFALNRPRPIFAKRLLVCAVLLLSACGGGGGKGGRGDIGSGPLITQQMGGARQGVALNLTGAVTTLAGSPFSQKDATGAAAKFNNPTNAVSVGGNLYVVDTYHHTIRQIEVATGVVTTLAGTAGFLGFTEGTATGGFTDGTGAAARFRYPQGLTTDGTNLYVADTNNHTIRQIVIATGVVTTLAGTAGAFGGSTDGTGAEARFYYPGALTTDGTNLYVADTNNHTIRQIVIATGVVTTLAGRAGASGANGTSAEARFYYPQGLTTDGTNLYVADTRNNTISRIVIATGVVTTLAGTAGVVVGSTNGIGAAARFNDPRGLTIDSAGTHLYVADTDNHTIRQIVIATGAVTTLAGTVGAFGSADGTGVAARFYFPGGLTTDGPNLYVADSYNHTIRQVVIATGVVTTLAGSASGDGTGPLGMFSTRIAQITTDGPNLYVADTYNHTIRQVVIATGVVTTLAGTARVFGSTDGTGAAAEFYFPMGLTTDGLNLYVADTDNHTIRRIVIATGVVTTLAGTAGAIGSADGTGVAVRFRYPKGLTTDGPNLYVADTGNHTIRRIVIATGVVTTLAGTAGAFGSADGTGAAVRFKYPKGLTTDGPNLYVVDTDNHTIRRIVIATGVVTTLAGTARASGFTDGTGAAAEFYFPAGLTTDGSNLYVVDPYNETIRRIVIATGVVTTLAGTARFYSPSGITTDGQRLLISDSEDSLRVLMLIAESGTLRVMQ